MIVKDDLEILVGFKCGAGGVIAGCRRLTGAVPKKES